MITVLYVENEQNDVLFMRRAFSRAGLEGWLQPLPDARTAMLYLTGEAPYADRTLHPLPRLLLIDLNMPAISGFELLNWLRQQPQLQELIVVIFSSSARPEDIKRASDLGAHDYLEKPTSGAQFGEVVQTLQQKWLGSATA
jgi:CheY-like chemotaxis protein